MNQCRDWLQLVSVIIIFVTLLIGCRDTSQYLIYLIKNSSDTEKIDKILEKRIHCEETDISTKKSIMDIAIDRKNIEIIVSIIHYCRNIYYNSKQLVGRIVNLRNRELIYSLVHNSYEYYDEIMNAVEKEDVTTLMYFVDYSGSFYIKEAFRKAIDKRSVKVIKLLIWASKGSFDILYKPFQDIIEKEDIEIIELFVKSDSYKIGDGLKEYGFIRASILENAKMLKIFLDNDVDIETLSHYHNYTALMISSQTGNIKILKMLLEHGANTRKKSSDNKTALDIAMQYGNLQAAYILAEKMSLKRNTIQQQFQNAAKKQKLPQQVAKKKEKNRWEEREPKIENNYDYGDYSDAMVFILDRFKKNAYETISHGEIVEFYIRRYFGGRIEKLDISTDGKIDMNKFISSIEYMKEYAEKNTSTHIMVNMSWGGKVFNPLLKNIFDEMTNHGFIFVAASGNDGSEGCDYPAGYKNVLAVSSLSHGAIERARYSNYGDCVSIAVPEPDIDDDLFPYRYYTKREQNELTKRGTSFSAAIATGIIASTRYWHPATYSVFDALKSNKFAALNVFGGVRELPRATRIIPYPSLKFCYHCYRVFN